MVGITAPGGSEPPSLGTLQASARWPGKACLSLSFSGGRRQQLRGPHRRESSVQSKAVTSEWALGPAVQGKSPWGHRSWGEAAVEPEGQVGYQAAAAQGHHPPKGLAAAGDTGPKVESSMAEGGSRSEWRDRDKVCAQGLRQRWPAALGAGRLRRARCAHPHARLGEVGPHSDLLPHAHVGVAVPLERGLQLLQLLACEVRALPPLLLFLGRVLPAAAACASRAAVLRPLDFAAALLL